MNILQEILDQLIRLEVSTETNPYSGLSVEQGEQGGQSVRIYDDYADGIYSPENLLEILKSLRPEEVSIESIWEEIRPAEV